MTDFQCQWRLMFLSRMTHDKQTIVNYDHDMFVNNKNRFGSEKSKAEEKEDCCKQQAR